MRIIVVSDTHSEKVPKALIEDIKRSDLVIHVGDFTKIEDLNQFKRLKEVRAVYGNMDGLDIREVLPRQDIIQCESVRIGLFHGEGATEGIVPRVRDRFKGDDVQAIVFGHTHEPMNEIMDGVLLFNPGSPTDTIRALFRSYGVLEVHGDEIKGKIVKLK